MRDRCPVAWSDPGLVTFQARGRDRGRPRSDELQQPGLGVSDAEARFHPEHSAPARPAGTYAVQALPDDVLQHEAHGRVRADVAQPRRRTAGGLPRKRRRRGVRIHRPLSSAVSVRISRMARGGLASAQGVVDRHRARRAPMRSRAGPACATEAFPRLHAAVRRRPPAAPEPTSPSWLLESEREEKIALDDARKISMLRLLLHAGHGTTTASLGVLSFCAWPVIKTTRCTSGQIQTGSPRRLRRSSATMGRWSRCRAC